jgi:hypothetical protein
MNEILLSTLNPEGKAQKRTGYTGKQKFIYLPAGGDNDSEAEKDCLTAKTAKITIDNKLCVIYIGKHTSKHESNVKKIKA